MKNKNKKSWNKNIICYNPLPLEKINIFIKWIDKCNSKLELNLSEQDLYNIYISNVGNIENIYHHNTFKVVLDYIMKV